MIAVVLFVYNRVIANRARDAELRHLGELETLSWQLKDLRSELTAAQTEAETLRNVLEKRAKLDRILTSPDVQLTYLAPVGAAREADGVVANKPSAASRQFSGFRTGPRTSRSNIRAVVDDWKSWGGESCAILRTDGQYGGRASRDASEVRRLFAG